MQSYYKGISRSEYKEWERKVAEAEDVQQLKQLLADLLNHIYYNTEEDHHG